MELRDFSPYVIQQILGHEPTRLKMLAALQERIMKYEHLAFQQPAILRDYPDTEVFFSELTKRVAEAEALYEKLKQ